MLRGVVSKQSTKPPSGMRDFLPTEVLRRRHVIDLVQRVYEAHGFVPLETPAIENHIRKSETFKITSVIQTSRKFGMTLLDDFIAGLVRENKVTLEDAVATVQSPANLYAKFGREP